MEKVSLDPEFENAVRICQDVAVKGTPNTGIGLSSGSEDKGAEKSSGTGAGRTSAQVGLRPFSLQWDAPRPTLSNSAQPQPETSGPFTPFWPVDTPPPAPAPDSWVACEQVPTHLPKFVWSNRVLLFLPTPAQNPGRGEGRGRGRGQGSSVSTLRG